MAHDNDMRLYQFQLLEIARYRFQQNLMFRGEADKGVDDTVEHTVDKGVDDTFDKGVDDTVDQGVEHVKAELVDKGAHDTYGEHVKAELVDKLDDQPVKEPEVTSEPTNKIPPLVPKPNIPEYAWVDWNDPEALIEEEMLAKKHGIENKERGPAPFPNGPELWRGMPFKLPEGCWGYWNRQQLPANYKFDDWWWQGGPLIFIDFH